LLNLEEEGFALLFFYLIPMTNIQNLLKQEIKIEQDAQRTLLSLIERTKDRVRQENEEVQDSINNIGKTKEDLDEIIKE